MYSSSGIFVPFYIDLRKILCFDVLLDVEFKRTIYCVYPKRKVYGSPNQYLTLIVINVSTAIDILFTIQSRFT